MSSGHMVQRVESLVAEEQKFGRVGLQADGERRVSTRVIGKRRIYPIAKITAWSRPGERDSLSFEM